jgi:hypothetical protein
MRSRHAGNDVSAFTTRAAALNFSRHTSKTCRTCEARTLFAIFFAGSLILLVLVLIFSWPVASSAW